MEVGQQEIVLSRVYGHDHDVKSGRVMVAMA
jgi:hypothetical protein